MPDDAGSFIAVETAPQSLTQTAQERLRQLITRIETLEEEKAGIASDIKDVFAELKGRGFDTKAVRAILHIRKKDHAERQEEEAILELYMQALGIA